MVGVVAIQAPCGDVAFCSRRLAAKNASAACATRGSCGWVGKGGGRRVLCTCADAAMLQTPCSASSRLCPRDSSGSV
eukprot:215419-Chlamydomonas_euryale.AAC.11